MQEECQSLLQLDKWILYLREICCLPVKIIYIIIKDGQVLPSSFKMPSSSYSFGIVPVTKSMVIVIRITTQKCSFTAV